MTDEEKVRAAWEPEEIKVSGHASPDEISAAWAAAAEFTAKQEQAIADVDEEIREVKFISRNFLDERLTVWKRIVARLEAHRAELARGMKA